MRDRCFSRIYLEVDKGEAILVMAKEVVLGAAVEDSGFLRATIKFQDLQIFQMQQV